MQIGHLNHLKYPSLGDQLTAGNAADEAGSAAPGAAKPGRGAEIRQLTPAQDAPGVVLKLQSGSNAQPGVAWGRDLVYSGGRKSEPADTTEADTQRMAEQHRQALQRSAAAPSALAVDKDGVLVSKDPGAASQDFVSFAVSTMRNYASEQERLKSEARAAEAATPLIPRSLANVQKLAARFNLFA